MAAYIGLVANALSTAVTVRREMDRDEKEWKVVMDKIGRISDLLDNVGKSCVKYNMREDNLPDSLRNILRETTTKLDELRRELTQGRDGILGKILSRDDLKMKVQQCDRELSDLIQYFLSALLLDARLAQIANERRNQSWPAPPGDRDWDSSPQIHQQSRQLLPYYGGQGYDGHTSPYGMVDHRTSYVQQQPQPHMPAYPNSMMMTTGMSRPREPQPSGRMNLYPSSNSAVVAGASRVGPQYPSPQPWEYPPDYRGNAPAPATYPAASDNWSAHQ